MFQAVSTDMTIRASGSRKFALLEAVQSASGLLGELERLRRLADDHSEERISLQALIDQVPDYLWVKDTESRFVVANKAIAADSGFADPGRMIGLTDFDIHAADMARGFRAVERGILESGKAAIGLQEIIVDARGVEKWLLSTKAPLRNERGAIVGIVGIARDITERKILDGLRDNEAKIMEMIAVGAPLEAVLDQVARHIETQMSGIACSILLLDEEAVHLRHGAAPSLASAYVKTIDGIEIGPEVGSCGTAVYRRESVIAADILTDPLWTNHRDVALAYGYRSCWSTPIFSQHGAVLGTFASYSKTVREPNESDVRIIDRGSRLAGVAIERKKAEDRIQFMATHDALTKLPVRALFKERVNQAMAQARERGGRVSVAFVDIDNFKLVNDSLGHGAGDELLKCVAGRMAASVRPSDMVARIGGDEFVILLGEPQEGEDGVAAPLQTIRDAIAMPMQIRGHSIRVTSSIGVANYPDDGGNAEMLLANSDAAMYRAKDFGRDNLQFYTPELNAEVQKKLLVREQLRNAIAASQFTLEYQPQVDLRTSRIFAVEALVRWNHPTMGRVSPAYFIPLAEEAGLIGQIGDWVLQTACRQNQAWREEGLAPITVCVNVSARQFGQSDWVSRVVDALERSRLDPGGLELELTESLIMQDVAKAVATMHCLRSLGVQFSIDDFGTGYSSLSALKKFPVGRLKIDKSFIHDIGAASTNDKAVAGAVISLGHKLDLRVIAEGVETTEQLAFLRDNDCDEMQGFFFSQPLAAPEIARLLRTNAAL
jgi:diguanylate cyclase (GGDEF)-like protein/PAS domain S-box-containing protein